MEAKKGTGFDSRLKEVTGKPIESSAKTGAGTKRPKGKYRVASTAERDPVLLHSSSSKNKDVHVSA